MTEIWKDIKETKGRYQVSDRGRVRNAETKKIRALTTNDKGYKIITLATGKGSKNFKVHRLVAIAFLPNPDNLPVVNHKDTRRGNNRLSNLEWSTHSDNLKHAYAMGNRSCKGKKNPSFNPEKIKFYHPDYGVVCCTRQDLIKRYQVDSTMLSKLIKGVVKTHRKWSLKK